MEKLNGRGETFTFDEIVGRLPHIVLSAQDIQCYFRLDTVMMKVRINIKRGSFIKKMETLEPI